MNNFFKLLTSYFEYKFSTLVTGTSWKSSDTSLVTTIIHNKNLAKELEHACQKHGFLTFTEYLHISQFGKYGYHATHTYHGATDTFTRWGEPLVRLCQQENIRHIIEFGCGNGLLGIEILQYTKRKHYPLFWSGIDSNQQLLQKAKELLQKNKVYDSVHTLTTKLDFTFPEKCLFVCSYSLDSIPPEIFINTTQKKTFPNALIGISVKNEKLQEIVLTKKQLQQKNLFLQNGMYIDNSGNQFDLSAWKLFPWQRAYIPVFAFSILRKITQDIPRNSFLMIIDEFQPVPLETNKNHLCIPKDLLRYYRNRELKNSACFYQTSGKNLLYYSSFLQTYLSVIRTLGFSNISYEEEHLFAKMLAGKATHMLTGVPVSFAIVAKKDSVQRKKNLLLVKS